jgi:quercetin dioxygenase-like cupin family protein
MAAVLLLTFVFSMPLAATPDGKAALAFTVDDPRLEWGPCPEFLPEGCGIAVLQGDPTEKNADVFFRLPPNSALPAHWHTSAERMILLSGTLHLTYKGQETMILGPGTYIYGPPRLPHDGFCAEGDPCVLFIAFELPVDAVPVEDGLGAEVGGRSVGDGEAIDASALARDAEHPGLYRVDGEPVRPGRKLDVADVEGEGDVGDHTPRLAKGDSGRQGEQQDDKGRQSK